MKKIIKTVSLSLLISTFLLLNYNLAFADVASSSNANQNESSKNEDLIDSETDGDLIINDPDIASNSNANVNDMSLLSNLDSTFTDPDWEYSEHNGKITITAYLGTDLDVVIPEEIDGFPVTELSSELFQNKGITSVIMSNTIDKIGNSVFMGCDKLTTVTLSSALKALPYNTFCYCEKLEYIELPSSLEEINMSSFASTNIRKINIPKNVSNIITDRFYAPYITNFTVDSQNDSFSSQNGMLLNKNGDTLYLYPTASVKEGDIIKLPSTITTIKNLGTAFNMPVGKWITYDLFLGNTIQNAENVRTLSSDITTWADPDSYIYRTLKINNCKVNPTTEDEFDEIMNSGFKIQFNDDNTIEVIEYKGTNDIMNIPSYFGTYKVTDMNGNCFYNEYVGTIIIPETIEKISDVGAGHMGYEYCLDSCRNIHKIVNNSSIDIPFKIYYHEHSKGWYEQEFSGGIRLDKIPANSTVYKHYGIKYSGFSNPEKYSLIDNYGYNEELLLPQAPYKRGYTFIGWKVDIGPGSPEGYDITSIPKGTNDNIWVSARYKYNGSSGGSGGSSNSGGGGSSHGIKSSTNASSQNTPGTWKQDEHGWWFQKKDGSYPKDEWVMNNNTWYRFDPNGYMQTGWIELNKIKYFLNPDGAMVSNNWTLQNDKWYFFNDSGAMQTGWVNWNKKWYYMNPDGSMAVNIMTPDGYLVGSNGEWIQ